MQRYFINPEQIQGQTVMILGDDVHHIKNVMRFRVGSSFICVDGEGHDYQVELTRISTQAVYGEIQEVRPSKGESKLQITLAQALPKGDRWDWILQKGTELGVSRFLPFQSERSLVKIHPQKIEKKRIRWQRIVKEAAEQSHRGKIPAVCEPITWEQLLDTIRQHEATWMAYEKGGTGLQTCLQQQAHFDHLLLVIGSEGGFAEHEVQSAVAAGATPVTLGSRILRTETASLAALSCILFAHGEFGGESK